MFFTRLLCGTILLAPPRFAAIPLTIESAAFNDQATQFSIEFNGEIELRPTASFLGPRSFLENLFQDEIESSMPGATATISASDASSIVVTLSASDVVFPAQSLTLYVNTIQPVDAGAFQLDAEEHVFALSNAQSPLSPIARISSMAHVGVCSDVVLSSFLSHGFGYRAPFYAWSSPHFDLLAHAISDSDATIIVPVESFSFS